jgi:hypothetical protein
MAQLNLKNCEQKDNRAYPPSCGLMGCWPHAADDIEHTHNRKQAINALTGGMRGSSKTVPKKKLE